MATEIRIDKGRTHVSYTSIPGEKRLTCVAGSLSVINDRCALDVGFACKKLTRSICRLAIAVSSSPPFPGPVRLQATVRIHGQRGKSKRAAEYVTRTM